MKNGTATDNDHNTLNTETLKAGEDTISNTVAKLYTKYLSERRIPTAWKNYIPSYVPSFVPNYIPRYVPNYIPSYVPCYVTSYVPCYVPSYVNACVLSLGTSSAVREAGVNKTGLSSGTVSPITTSHLNSSTIRLDSHNPSPAKVSKLDRKGCYPSTEMMLSGL